MSSPPARPVWPVGLTSLLAFALLLGLTGTGVSSLGQGGDKKDGDTKKKDDEPKKKPAPKATIPPQFTLKGHTDWVLAIAYNKEGTRLASASRDKTVKVWDAANGKELFTLKGHPREVHGVAFSPDGKWLASTTGQWLKKEQKFQGEVRLWTAADGKPARTLAGHTELVTAVAFHPENKQLASAADDKLIILWDPEKGSQIHVLKGHTAPVRAVAYSPDGKYLASGGDDMTVKLWDTESGKDVATLKGFTRNVTALAFTPDGKRLVAGALDGMVKAWDLTDNNKEVLNLKAHSGVLGVTVNRDGTRLAAAGWDQVVELWDSTGEGTSASFWEPGRKEVFSFPAVPAPASVTGILYSPDGRHLATGGTDNLVKIWETDKMK